MTYLRCLSKERCRVEHQGFCSSKEPREIQTVGRLSFFTRSFWCALLDPRHGLHFLCRCVELQRFWPFQVNLVRYIQFFDLLKSLLIICFLRRLIFQYTKRMDLNQRTTPNGCCCGESISNIGQEPNQQSIFRSNRSKELSPKSKFHRKSRIKSNFLSLFC